MTTTATVPTPEWLTRRDASLRRGTQPTVYLVLVSGTPQYRLFVTPVSGKFGCAVTQTNNGRRLDAGGVAATHDDALRLGLGDLQKALGWE